MSFVHAGVRDADWSKVNEAMEKDQPKTASAMLKDIGAAALAEKAWGEAAKAIGIRVALDGRVEGGPAAAIKQLDTELATAPAEVKPVLRAMQASWVFAYYQQNRWRFAVRSATAAAPGEDMETWDLQRILGEVDKRFRDALADRDTLRATPVADFGSLFTAGDLGDAMRPTVYDFIAHHALEFYGMDEVAAAKPENAFELAAASPALDSPEALMDWKPDVAGDDASPAARALRLFQDLLAFHKGDVAPDAFLHCDLERLRWAGRAVVGPEKDARQEKALRGFIEANVKHPLSADARQDLARLLIDKKKNKEAHAVALAGAEAFPEHPFGKLCRNIVHELEEKRLNIEMETQWTPAGSEIVVRHRNVAQVFFRAYVRPWGINKETLGGGGLPERGEALAAVLGGRPALAWDVPLVDDGDFAEREARLVAPEGLKPGYYWIVASADEGFGMENNHIAVAGVTATNLSLLLRTGMARGGAEGIVTDALTGAPVAGAKVTMARERNMLPGLRKEDTRTDANGYFAFKPQEEYAMTLFVAEHQGNRAFTRSWNMGEAEDEDTGPEDAVVFFTDRAIYRPGQTIHFKGIWCRADERKADYATVAKASLWVVLKDPNGKEVERLEFTTNERGAFAGTFTAPAGSVLGTFSIESPHGQTRINIEEYKRPKFSVEIKPPESPAVLGGEVKVAGKATAYTGAAVDGAKVTWRVTRLARWPVWIRWCWWFVPPPAGEAKEIAHGTAVTGVDGVFTVVFPAQPDKSIDPATEPVFDFHVTADVTDGAGETRTAVRQVSVAYTALTARIEADSWIGANEETILRVSVESHDGEPRAAEGILRVHRLKEPEVCARPPVGGGESPDPLGEVDADPVDGSPANASPDPDKWELGEVLRDFTVKTDGKRAAEVKLTLPAGLYRAVFETKDANGKDVQAMVGLHAVDMNAEKFAPKIPFFAGAPDEECQPGQTYTLVWGSGFPGARALVEWFKDGRLEKREWSAPGRTQQSFTRPVDEASRGGFHVRITQMTMNSLQTEVLEVDVPWKNKELALRWEHLTSKLEPGAKETWTAIITGPGGEAAVAEMVATLYDASLDAFLPHSFGGLAGLLRGDAWPSGDGQFSTEASGLQAFTSWRRPDVFAMANPYRSFIAEVQIFGGMDPFSGARNGGGALRMRAAKGMAMPMVAPMMADAAPAMEAAVASPPPAAAGNRSGDFAVTRGAIDSILNTAAVGAPAAAAPPAVAARKNLQETAFFFPHLLSDEKGEVRMTFTMPEALTKWQFLGCAHDAVLRSGMLEGETVTAKDLMVQPNPPRFLREGDVLEFTVRITNAGDKEQAGGARLALTDAATGKDVTPALGVSAPEQAFAVPAKESRTLSWRLTVPDGAGFLQYKAVASSGSLSDGEEGWLPVIPRRILVTESMALPVRDAGEKKFTFRKLRESGASGTLQTQFLHVQAVSQPAWYAVLALPYLMEFPHECSEQTFNRYYANALAGHIANSDPKIQQVFARWKGTDALDSPLMKNQDLKGILLEETPWLREAKDEAAARRRVGLLFDANHMGDQLERALQKLKDMQHHDGLWPWFPGGPGSEYISLYIATGFGRLRQLGVATDISPALMALPALDRELRERHEEIKRAKSLGENHLSPWIAHHLYTRTFFLKDVAIGRGDQEAFDYFTGQAKQYWASLDSRMARAHAALALHRLGDTVVPKLVTRSLRENAVSNEEMGMWWKDAEGEGWWWWRAPIETQAMMVEAFREIDADAKAVDDCQVWLLKQKQVQDWKTTKATADAVYALLLGGKNLLGSDALLEISLGGKTVKPEKPEVGTGFYEARFQGAEVTPEFGDIVVRKSDPGVAWASVHWQYLEDMAKVTAHDATPLKLEKALFVRRNTARGPELEAVAGPVKVGDELVTRLVLRNDRAMEFVHLKDLRGSGTEPVNVLSGYRQQDGFGYYEVTRDTASHFFIDYLPPGTHVFETSVRVQHAGVYQTGIAEIRCMYAPEFNAHSGSIRLEVLK